jgi:hypothetical protein
MKVARRKKQVRLTVCLPPQRSKALLPWNQIAPPRNFKGIRAILLGWKEGAESECLCTYDGRATKPGKGGLISKHLCLGREAWYPMLSRA